MKTCFKCKKTLSISEFYPNRTKNDGLSTYCKKCEITYPRNWSKHNKERARFHKMLWSRRNMGKICRDAVYHRLNQKIIVTQVYSKGKMCCNNCGYDENLDALTIDHIDSNKTERNKRYIYTWIIANNFPDNLQILCMNCQFIKRITNNECARSSFYKKIGNKNITLMDIRRIRK